jgi:small acid-soluble spore protein O (minor)
MIFGNGKMFISTNIISKNHFIFIFSALLEIVPLLGGDFMANKPKANHVIPGANAARAQGKGAGFNEEIANEPLTVLERMNNKKRKKNQ